MLRARLTHDIHKIGIIKRLEVKATEIPKASRYGKRNDVFDRLASDSVSQLSKERSEIWTIVWPSTSFNGGWIFPTLSVAEMHGEEQKCLTSQNLHHRSCVDVEN